MGRIVLWLKAAEGSDLLLLGLLGEEDSLDVGEDTTLGNGDSREKFVQFLVITDGELEMTGDDPGLLVVTGSVASQLEDLSGEVLHDGGQIDGGSGTNTGGVVTLPQETVDTAHGELESSTAGAGLGLGLNFSSLTTSGHFESLKFEFKLMRCGGCGGLYPRPRLMSTNRHFARAEDSGLAPSAGRQREAQPAVWRHPGVGPRGINTRLLRHSPVSSTVHTNPSPCLPRSQEKLPRSPARPPRPSPRVTRRRRRERGRSPTLSTSTRC